MFYDIVIHPSRIELIHRFLNSETGDLTEKKLAYKDLSYKFDQRTVEKGASYENVKKDIAELVEPYKNELNSLNIIPPGVFFQSREFICSPANSAFEEYITWEACQMATDLPEHYKFGYTYDEPENKIILTLVRKTVFDYFYGIMYELYEKEIEFRLFSRSASSAGKTQLVEVNRELKNPLAFSDSAETSYTPVSLDDEPVSKKRSGLPFFIIIFLAVVSAASFYFYRTSLKNGTEESSVTVAHLSQTEAVFQEIEVPVQTQTAIQEEPQEEESILPEIAKSDPGETLPEKIIDTAVSKEPDVKPKFSKTPPFWDYIKALTETRADSISFINRTEIGVFSSDSKLLDEIRNIYSDGSFSYNKNETKLTVTHSSFVFERARLMSNFEKFVEIKDLHGIEPIRYYENIFRIEPITKFIEFIDDLEKNNVGFRKFIIEMKSDHVIFTVYFG